MGQKPPGRRHQGNGRRAFVAIGRPPEDPAEHASQSAREWADRPDEYCALRKEELGIPEHLQGAEDIRPNMKWCDFDPVDRDGGGITSGIAVNGGVLNPDLMKGKKGGRIWPRLPLRDRIDAIICHEYEENRLGTHEAAPKTKLPITDGARQLNRALAR